MEIKKRWKEYTEELYKKDLNDLDNHDDVVTHPEPDILECEVKWTLRSTAVNKASEGDGISAELFKILKDDAIKVLQLSMSAHSENPAVATGLEQSQFSSQFPRRAVLKNVQTTKQLHSSPMLVRLCSKSCMLGFSIT